MIRHQVARSTQFRGYGPASAAFSGLLAFAVAFVQSGSVVRREDDFIGGFGVWIGTAAVVVVLSSLEMLARATRAHSGFAQEMILSAVEQLLPAFVAGLLMTLVFVRVAPEAYWMLPGLWELLFSMGIFASCRFLPRPMFAAGVWYLVAGLCSLLICGATKTFSPWAMGLPFGVGQVAIAAVLGFGREEAVG